MYTREHVVTLPVMTLIAPVTLVVRWSHGVLRRRQHDLVAARHALLMVVMMVAAGHHLVMGLLIVLMVDAGVAWIIDRALLHVFTSDSEISEIRIMAFERKTDVWRTARVGIYIAIRDFERWSKFTELCISLPISLRDAKLWNKMKEQAIKNIDGVIRARLRIESEYETMLIVLLDHNVVYTVIMHIVPIPPPSFPPFPENFQLIRILEMYTCIIYAVSVAKGLNVVHRAQSAVMGMRGVHGRRGDGGRVTAMGPHGAHAHRAARVHGDRRHAHARQGRHGEIRRVRVDALQGLHAAAVAHRAADSAVGRGLAIQWQHVPTE